ncbi:hypothetical protein PUR49_02620 [Streptomyces sp. BE147]|uniref:hypothetical protein n=1 Tax=Streptomyces sp. BE147 TaxID=3002524 RepID=UPI002E774400|nr:hypothetical protein [Streptomyces sp. BE147]MEE1735429.1 hypothetical protein [Streptomyces sp. BE147]
MPDVIEVSVPSTALFILMLTVAAVVGPPAVSSVTGWWSIRLRRWAGRLGDAWARFVAWVREALRRFLGVDGSR